MNTVFEGVWSCLEDLKEWDDAYEYLSKPGIELLVAGYDQYDYGSGGAYAYWIEDDQLHEAHDNHCSCYGLDTFVPEVSEVEAVMKYRSLTEAAKARIQEVCT